MPRPVETSITRRVLMPWIMWLILAATIGLAALVDAHKTRRGVVTLGEPQMIQEVSLRLPRDWNSVGGGERTNQNASLEVREDNDDLSARVLSVSIDQPNLLEAFKLRQRPVAVINGVPFGDQLVPLTVYNIAEDDPEAGATYFIQHFEISRRLGNFRVLTMRLSHAGVEPGGRDNPAAMNEDVELLKKVAGTMTITQ